MNILFLGNNSFKIHKRGVENVIDFQSNACNFEFIYYLHWGATTTAYKSGKFTCISIKQCWFWPMILNFVLYKLKKKRTFITNSHNSLFAFFSLFRTDVYTVHDALFYLEKSKERKFVFHFKIIEFLLYFRCHIVHFVSIFAKEQSLFGNRENYVIINNTSHLEGYISKTKYVKLFTDQKDILIVRTIEERARIDLVIEVAKEFQTQGRRFNFIIAGKGPLLKFYQDLISKIGLKNIQLLGYISDIELVCLYQKCELVLMVAEYGEGFGLPIIEGYLFNKPVIASNRCAIPEIIISEDFLFENNVFDIINKIDFALANCNFDFRQYYFEKFSQKRILMQFNNLFNRLLVS